MRQSVSILYVWRGEFERHMRGFYPCCAHIVNAATVPRMMKFDATDSVSFALNPISPQ